MRRIPLPYTSTDATSHTDHAEEDTRVPPHLSGPVPPPLEVISAADPLSGAPDSDILAGWKSQIRRLKEMARACDPMRTEWDRMAPKLHRGASACIKSVALLRLMSQFGL